MIWCGGGGWAEAKWLLGAAVKDCSAHLMLWAHLQREKRLPSLLLKAATDYTSCPTDKHAASSQDTQSRPAAPEESGDLAGYDNLRLFVDNQGPLTTALAVCADL